MRIFLSYASEDVDAAQKIASAIQAAGHSVFFDKNDLKSGREYDTSIRNEINRSDAYIFLVSGNSIAPGRYTLTELAFAEKRFPNPSGHVLPVMLESVEWARIPAYLTSVTILGLRGNGPAEVVAALAELHSRRYSFRQVVAAAAVSMALAGALAGAAAMLWPSSRDQDEFKLAYGGFGESPDLERVRFNNVWIGSLKASVGKIEARIFDSRFAALKTWELNKEMLVAGNGSWDLPDGFEVARGGAQAFVEVCFHVAGHNSRKPRTLGYVRAVSLRPAREHHSLASLSLDLVDRATTATLSAKTGCDYVL
jgi:hypothetical protein